MVNDKKSPLVFWAQIKQVLLRDWDPIGIQFVMNVRDDNDEYDMYVPCVYTLLNSGKNIDDLSSYLMSIETERMGLTPGKGEEKRVHEVAEKLSLLWKEYLEHGDNSQ
jgi:hypothetical protein